MTAQPVATMSRREFIEAKRQLIHEELGRQTQAGIAAHESERQLREVREKAVWPLAEHGIELRIRAGRYADTAVALRDGPGSTSEDREPGTRLMEAATEQYAGGSACRQRALGPGGVRENPWPIREIDERRIWDRHVANVPTATRLLQQHRNDPGGARGCAAGAVEAATRNPAAPGRGLAAKFAVLKRQAEHQHPPLQVMLALQFEHECRGWAEQAEAAG